ncbi:DUF6179 domain-containing protein [[Clostridium] fimetarium]|uniref:Uncharacterized protein n=1 Tax=[Clostridium] fimetarium TaxID=99656 RepID=A0A1I0R6W9_9FIRM|nr:DUF6179 domain-containing protein [[Clostridium] fimetarium]SEW36379.1 hypothetical protein SAMN05421659_11286 [[Clostridium] fimetarium]
MNKFEMEELIPIVAELTEKYTSKESTSVSYNTAKQLMNAVIYCMNEIDLVNYELDSGAAKDMAVKDMTEQQDSKLAYRTGYELVVKKVFKTKALFEEIALDFNAYRNRAYYETVMKGMPAFFLYYDPKFNPQNHILTLDYPTIKSVQDSCGIDAIYEYLSYTKLEQELLKAFPEEYITTLLSSYHADYEELFINVGSIVLRNIIVCMILGKNITNHCFEKKDAVVLKKYIESSSQEELEIKLCNLVKILVNQGYNHNEQLYEYLKEDVKNISFELINAVEHDCLDIMFLL